MSLKRFYADPYYNIRAFVLQAALASVLCVLFYSLHSPEFYSFTFSWWQPIMYAAIGVYLGGLSCVWIHNSTHKSFKSSLLNETCGTLAGLHQLWGLNGWRLIHLVHHQYSDHPEYDPHPPLGRTYWQFTRDMFIRSSFTISKRYREHWKEMKRTKLLQKLVFVAFLAATLSTLLMWYLLLGPVAFVFGFIPSLVWNHLMFAHINFACHPADETGQTAAANLNHNIYYNVANAIWHGIYFHGNHHRRPMLFNPRYMEARVRNNQADDEMQEAA